MSRIQNRGRWSTLIAAGLSSCLACSFHNPASTGALDEEARASFRHALAAGEAGEFTLQGVSGSMEVMGAAGTDSIVVSGERVVRSDDASDARGGLAALFVDVRSGESAVTVCTRQPNRPGGRSYEVHYRVSLPSRLRVSAGQVNGAVLVSGMNGRVAVASINGDVECRNGGGDCEISLVNGRIVCTASPRPGGACLLSAVNGDVSLSVPDTTSARLEASVTNGTVSVDGLVLQNLQASRTSVSGVIGRGTGTVRASTVNGNVRIQGES